MGSARNVGWAPDPCDWVLVRRQTFGRRDWHGACAARAARRPGAGLRQSLRKEPPFWHLDLRPRSPGRGGVGGGHRFLPRGDTTRAVVLCCRRPRKPYTASGVRGTDGQYGCGSVRASCAELRVPWPVWGAQGAWCGGPRVGEGFLEQGDRGPSGLLPEARPAPSSPQSWSPPQLPPGCPLEPLLWGPGPPMPHCRRL